MVGVMNDAEFAALVKKEIFIALVWSFGANIHDSSLEKFNTFAREVCADLTESLPSTASIFDFYVDNFTHKFTSFEAKIEPFVYKPEVPFFSILVPTLETTRYNYLLETVIGFNRNVLMIGDNRV